MEFIIGLVLGMLIAALAIRWMAQQAITKLLDQIEQDQTKIDNNMRVKIEFEQNIYFLYNNDDGSFVAQGTNLIDLKTNLQQRFPNRTITIVDGNPEALKTLKQQLEQHNIKNASAT